MPPNESLSPPDEVPLPPIDVPPPPEKVTRTQVEVFDQAYDEVKKDEPGVVEAYEKILSGQLSSDVAATDVEGDPDNIIGKTAAMRKDQMNRLVDEGRVRTEKVAAIKENINKVIEPFNHLRSVISWAVRSEPAASAAWVGITTLLDACYPVLFHIRRCSTANCLLGFGFTLNRARGQSRGHQVHPRACRVVLEPLGIGT